jgi:hypothetical protein
VELHHGNGPGGRELRRLDLTRHRRDSRDALRCVGGEAVGHHPAVRDARRVHAALGDRCATGEVVQDREREPDVVRVGSLGRTTALARVPRPQALLTRRRRHALRVHHDEPVPVGRRIHLRVRLLGRRIAAAAVEVEHDGQALPGLSSGGNVDEVLASASIEVDREPLVSRRQLLGAGGVAGTRRRRREHDAGHDGQNGQDRQPAHDQHGTDGSSWVRRVHVPIP